MNALSTRLTSLGLPAILGVVLALALALTTGLSSLNFGWMMRATKSTEPPGTKGTIMRIGRDG